jgi:hypothetical protein
MTLTIERITGKCRTRIRLSGEVRAEHLDQLKADLMHATGLEKGGIEWSIHPAQQKSKREKKK